MKKKFTSKTHGNQSKTVRKNGRQSVKTSPKKLLAKRTSIKLRASTGKCVAKRTRDKTTKLPLITVPQKCLSGPSGKKKSDSHKVHVSCKPKCSIQAKSTGILNQVSKKAAVKSKEIIKAKTKKNMKGNLRKKIAKQLGSNEFVDIWAYVSIGKREASLNASMKVNIMFEKHSPLKSNKKIEKAVDDSILDEHRTKKVSGKGKVNVGSSDIKSKNIPSHSVKELSCLKDKDDETSKDKFPSQDPKIVAGKNDGKKTVYKSKSTDIESRKRKSNGNKTCQEEPSVKMRKVGKKLAVVQKNKAVRKYKKSLTSGHHLCNIIEKSPRQASLIAKAMIAMGQEDDTFYESAARTQIYDWIELRSHTRTESRRIVWFNGLGKASKNSDENLPQAEDNERNVKDVDINNENVPNSTTLDSETLHETLLRTLHHIGDSKLLKEYLRAQKEDYLGSVDVEKCTTPEKQVSLCPEPKTNSATEVGVGLVEKMLEKTASVSPIKPQPCRVVTPVLQLPPGQRTSNVASFIHNPIAQSIYPQQHNHAHPQPIKVTPYPIRPDYIYQYAMDRPQHKTYASPSSSPMLYGISNNEVTHRQYSTPFALSHVGRLGLDRRSVTQYQPAAYSAPLHLPIQQLGINYRTYYPTAIHALPQQSMPALPLHQQYPMIQTPVATQHQINQDVGQLGSYQHGYSSYPPLSSMRHNESCMPPPLPSAHRRTPLAPPVSMRQPPISGHSLSLLTPMESLRSFNPAGVQPMVNLSVSDISPDHLRHHQSNQHKQFPALPPSRPHYQQFINHPCQVATNPATNYSLSCNGLNKSLTLCKKNRRMFQPQTVICS